MLHGGFHAISLMLMNMLKTADGLEFYGGATSVTEQLLATLKSDQFLLRYSTKAFWVLDAIRCLLRVVQSTEFVATTNCAP